MTIGTDKKAPVKLEDVAQAADVSIATVSLALRNHHSVTEETRKRVIEAQKRLGYTPLRKRGPSSKTAKEKAQQRQTFLYCIVDFPVKKYEYTAFLEGVMDACKEKRIRLELASLSTADVLAGGFSEVIPQEAKGVILTGQLNQEVVDRFCNEGLKVIALGNYDLVNVHKVEVDIFRGGRFIAQRILEEGHKEIACLLGNPRNYFERQYMAGIRDTLAMNGMEFPSANLFYTDENDLFGSMSKIVAEILARQPKITAVISHATNIAEAFLAEYRAQARPGGKKGIPSIYLTKSSSKEPLNPHLAMLNMNMERCGQLAVLNLCQIIAHRVPVNSMIVETDGWDD